MTCLECRKEGIGNKFCSKKCGTSYRVRMYRLKRSGSLLPGTEIVLPAPLNASPASQDAAESKKETPLILEGTPQERKEPIPARDLSHLCKSAYHK